MDFANETNLKLIATILVIVGAFNWLSVGANDYNFVNKAIGDNSKWVYMLVGAAGAYLVYLIVAKYQKTGKWEAMGNESEYEYDYDNTDMYNYVEGMENDYQTTVYESVEGMGGDYTYDMGDYPDNEEY